MCHVLVCDDERDIVAALKIYLEADGYHVLTASNGREALEVCGKEKVDLILLDIMMPGMDGITAMSRLREFSNVPIILLTAKSEDTDKILGLNIGAYDYITKPFNPVEVLARAVAAAAVFAARRLRPEAGRSAHRRRGAGRQCQNRHAGR